MNHNFRKVPRQPGRAPRLVRPRLCMQPAPVDKPGPRALAWPRVSLWRKKLERPIISEAQASGNDTYYCWPTSAGSYSNTSTERLIVSYGYGSGTTYAPHFAKGTSNTVTQW